MQRIRIEHKDYFGIQLKNEGLLSPDSEMYYKVTTFKIVGQISKVVESLETFNLHYILAHDKSGISNQTGHCSNNYLEKKINRFPTSYAHQNDFI